MPVKVFWCVGQPCMSKCGARPPYEEYDINDIAMTARTPLGVSHGWDNTVKTSFDEFAGTAVELVIAMFQAA